MKTQVRRNSMPPLRILSGGRAGQNLNQNRNASSFQSSKVAYRDLYLKTKKWLEASEREKIALAAENENLRELNRILLPDKPIEKAKLLRRMSKKILLRNWGLDVTHLVVSVQLATFDAKTGEHYVNQLSLDDHPKILKGESWGFPFPQMVRLARNIMFKWPLYIFKIKSSNTIPHFLYEMLMERNSLENLKSGDFVEFEGDLIEEAKRRLNERPGNWLSKFKCRFFIKMAENYYKFYIKEAYQNVQRHRLFIIKNQQNAVIGFVYLAGGDKANSTHFEYVTKQIQKTAHTIEDLESLSYGRPLDRQLATIDGKIQPLISAVATDLFTQELAHKAVKNLRNRKPQKVILLGPSIAFPDADPDAERWAEDTLKLYFPDLTREEAKLEFTRAYSKPSTPSNIYLIYYLGQIDLDNLDVNTFRENLRKYFERVEKKSLEVHKNLGALRRMGLLHDVFSLIPDPRLYKHLGKNVKFLRRIIDEEKDNLQYENPIHASAKASLEKELNQRNSGGILIIGKDDIIEDQTFAFLKELGKDCDTQFVGTHNTLRPLDWMNPSSQIESNLMLSFLHDRSPRNPLAYVCATPLAITQSMKHKALALLQEEKQG